MKPKLIKTLLLLLTLVALAGCEEHVDYKDDGLNFDVDKDLQSALQQKRMPLLAVRLGCNACHAIDRKLVGPAWEAVGKRYANATTYEYKGKSYPIVEGLVQKVSHGGTGNWGVESMPALDPSGAKHDQIEKLVGFILKLGKQ
jgi:cytochrome c